MEINKVNADDNTEMLNCNVVSTKVPENCRCDELEGRSKKAEVMCAELEFELQRKKKDCEALVAKLEAVELEKFAVENELKVLWEKNEGKEKNPVICAKERGLLRRQQGQESCERDRRTGPTVDLTEQDEDEDVVCQLMMENTVLECEKKRAESEVEVWKDKFKNLESHAYQLGLGLASLGCHERNGKEGAQGSNWNRPEENLHLGNSLNFLQNQEKVAKLVNVASYCVSPAKEIGDLQSGFVAGTPSNDVCQRSLGLDSKMQLVKKARKQLTFEPEGNPNKNTVLSVPVGGKSAYISVIDIIDSDDESNITKPPLQNDQGRGSVSVPTCFTDEKEKNSEDSLKQGCNAQNKEEDLDFGEDVPFVATPKRKRTCNVVTSDSESDDDDNVPICKLQRKHIQEVSPGQVRCDLNNSLTAASSADEKVTGTVAPRRRLQPLRKCVGRIQEDKKVPCRAAKPQQSISTNEDNDDEEPESASEGESLGGFIVNDSDVSYCEDASSKSQGASDGDVDSISSNSQDVPDGDKDSDSSMSQNASNRDMNFGKILSRIRRNKDLKMKWDFEGDMLAAFGKDPELCMKAVCALYRRQTSEEQMSKGALYCNHRGFSKFDALRGCTLAEFLTDGNSHGDLKKSVKELKEYDPKAVEQCRTLAIRYSKQLFEIYKNKEDPLFP